jgi:hypothetical protein
MYSVNTTIDDIIDALVDFLTPFLPDNLAIVRAQVNRVPPPGVQFVKLTEIINTDLSVPYLLYAPIEDTTEISTNIVGPTRLDVQIDFYGESSGDWCRTIQNVVRCGYGFDNFPSNIKPLYTSDGTQTPLITGEEQYLSRWTLTLSVQYNPMVELPQESATEVVANPVLLANP